MSKFPKDLADVVFTRWNDIVAGDYVAPECPSKKILKEILEACYIAGGAPEEGRYPKFNVVVGNVNGLSTTPDVVTYSLSSQREVTVDEIRRLAPATDARKSAIWITFDDHGCKIAGICDLGTSWHRARLGLIYNYRVPRTLLIQVDRPGKLKVYQGEFAVASLADGNLSVSRIEMHLYLHKAAHNGFACLVRDFTLPEIENARDFESFCFTALCNVFSALANSIGVLEHGGMLVLLPVEEQELDSHVRTKYRFESNALREAFVGFINARNTTADFWTAVEQEIEWPGNSHEAELKLLSATERLVEAIRFVAQLAGCDGAILLTSDLRLLGFGAEIRAEMLPGTTVSEVKDELARLYRSCDVEQFGMRHRSAIKLVSRLPSVCVLAVSQDGPISAVWAEENSVFVKKGAALGNMNIPWA